MKSHGDQASETFGTLSYKIHQLKKQIQAERVASIKEKLDKNGKKLESHVSHVVLATVSKDVSSMEENGFGKILSSRIKSPLCKFNGFAQGSGDKDFVNTQEVIFSTSTKLPSIEQIPPYTTWIFLDRNQRMAEDQSVVGRRRIYYDQHGSEALIGSDSEEEITEPEEDKREFSEGEDRILWMAFQEHGSNDEAVNIVNQFIGGTSLEIQEPYDTLKEKYEEKHDEKGSREIGSERNILLEKSLGAALDSFDNLFCRRCLVFDCRLHGCSQNLIDPSEKQSSWSEYEEHEKPCSDQCYLQEQEIPTRSRLFRRRGRTRKLKYSWKSAGHPSIWKRIADGKNQSCKQYTPCGCQSMCGKQCPCLHNGTCCEKYCGCSKSCKNRFRGCHCAKSQCRRRQCPCFAAGRECDPDVCRNCWVSCGDGSLGEPPRRGDGQCGNMRLLLRQQQKILLAKSDVAGWGAFIKNPVNKNDYLGEYTGELISHREADKRGKIYDRANSSFLFDLNDQYVLDAYRKGDKLKFANHSSNPNCYAKVMLVAGDHRVGIFAKEHIEASEELFYDYRYGPDQAPIWARKPEGSKRDDSTISQGRAKKHQSH